MQGLKFVLGFTQEVYQLALKNRNSRMDQCRLAAENIINLDMNIKVTYEMFHKLNAALKKISEMRTGFFCILCDARTQSKLSDFWNSTNFFNKVSLIANKLYYDKSFCQKLVNDQIKASYLLLYYFKPYVDNMVTLMNCQTGENVNVEFYVPEEVQQQVKNCYYMRNKFFFYFCEKYCEQFSITSPTDMFDGDLKQMKKIVEFVRDRRVKVFDYPNNNILTDGVRYELNIQELNWQVVFDEKVFFRPTQQEHLLDL